jgi:hypothetical protein
VLSDQSRVYKKPASIKEQHENKETERLMIGNVSELQETARREIVVGEVGTAAPESPCCYAIFYTCCNAIN